MSSNKTTVFIQTVVNGASSIPSMNLTPIRIARTATFGELVQKMADIGILSDNITPNNLSFSLLTQKKIYTPKDLVNELSKEKFPDDTNQDPAPNKSDNEVCIWVRPPIDDVNVFEEYISEDETIGDALVRMIRNGKLDITCNGYTVTMEHPLPQGGHTMIPIDKKKTCSENGINQFAKLLVL